MKKELLVLSLLGGLYSAGATASTNDGNGLLSDCNDFLNIVDSNYQADRSDPLLAGQCVGYVRGVSDLITDQGGPACMPRPRLMAGQIVRIVVNYGKNHPTVLDKQRLILVTSALQDAYPCDKSR